MSGEKEPTPQAEVTLPHSHKTGRAEEELARCDTEESGTAAQESKAVAPSLVARRCTALSPLPKAWLESWSSPRESA